MKILSVRRGFLADHSSTSYEFLAVDKPLNPRARAAVSKLSSRAIPTSRRVSFVYHAEGYDIPGGWEPLMLKHYDVMYSESYDWWTLAVSFDTNDKALISKLRDYAFDGVDDLGISVNHKKGRIVVTVSCRLVTDALAGDPWDDAYYGDEDEDEDEGLGNSGVVATDDTLLDLLARVRSCLMRGECEPLWAVWEEYGNNDDDDDDDDDDDEDEAPPRPEETASGRAVAAELASMLGSL